MIGRRLLKLAAIPAVALVAGLTMVGWTLAPDALAKTPNRLQLFIDNQTNSMIYRTTKFSIDSSPTSIAPYATGEIKADSAEQVYASMTYADNADADAASCSVQVQVNYGFDSTTQRCDNKKFTYYRVGQCEVEQMGACSGANSCKCNFVFSRTN